MTQGPSRVLRKSDMKVVVIGAGLAGSEAALQLAKKGIEVDLYEMRPENTTGAHKTEKPAELVCSNSLGSNDVLVASGLLKQELRVLDSELIKAADETAVPAGNALAIDRELFSSKIEEKIKLNPKINFIRKEIKKIPDSTTPVIIAAGPLCSEELSEDIKNFVDSEYLSFYDAIAPIVEKESLDFSKAFYANRYNKGDASYINCPMNKEQYLKFYDILINSPKIELKDFEKKAKFFESCLPIEVLASRGVDTLRYGPLKPVGLVDDRTGEKNYAVVQLRQDNLCASLYNLVGFQTNLKWSAQKELLQSIPGMEHVNIVRYGVMHKNTFLFSPKVLRRTLQSKKRENLFFCGQMTGTEGYTEAIASGLVAGVNMARYLSSETLMDFPSMTMIGALLKYITYEGHATLNPINSNWGIIKQDEEVNKKFRKDKKLKNEFYAKRSLECLKTIK